MKKLLLALAALALSCHVGAATPTPAGKAASAPKPAADAAHTKADLKAAKDRGALMSACQSKSDQAGLRDVERKDFLTACMAGK